MRLVLCIYETDRGDCDEESSELRFFAPDELPQEIAPAIVPILKKYLQK